MLNALSNNVNAFSGTAAKLNYMKDFKAYMTKARLRAGYPSQEKAAIAIGCKRGTVGMWEAPSSPVESISADLLWKVAVAYRIRPEFLNGLIEDDGFPWSPSGGAASVVSPSQDRRYDVRILAQAIERVGADGFVPGDLLFTEYERLSSLSPSKLVDRKKQGDQGEPKQRGSAGTGQHPKRQSGSRKK